MVNIPDLTILLSYILNGILGLVVFFFIIKPIGKAFIHSLGKMVGTKHEVLMGTVEENSEKVQNLKEMEKQRRLEEIKKQNDQIKEQAEKEVEAMESKVIADLFDGKGPGK